MRKFLELINPSWFRAAKANQISTCLLLDLAKNEHKRY